MKNKLRLGMAFLCVSASFLVGSDFPVKAQALNGSVRRISISSATGSSGQPAVIELASGSGVNISFLPIHETVQKVWLDNPSFVTLDTDGCLAGLGGQPLDGRGEQQTTTCAGANVLHLRRINPLRFPNLPKSNSSLLTVISSTNRVYLFRLVMSSKPKYYTVEITPPATATMNVVPQQNGYSSFNPMPIPQSPVLNFNVNNLKRGLELALKARLLSPYQPLYARIQLFLSRTQTGQPLEVAARQSGISMTLVKRLNDLGMGSVSTTLPTSPTSPTTPTNTRVPSFSQPTTNFPPSSTVSPSTSTPSGISY